MIKSKAQNNNTTKILIFLLALAAIFIVVPFPQSITNIGTASLSYQAQVDMGILIFALMLWMTEAIPFHITGMLSVFLLALLKVDTFKTIKKMGHAGAIVTGGKGNARGKIDLLRSSGAYVAEKPAMAGELLRKAMM